MTVKWAQQEPGWHTSERGGVVRENGGWWFYPIDKSQKYGPFRSMAAAKLAARQSPEDVSSLEKQLKAIKALDFGDARKVK